MVNAETRSVGGRSVNVGQGYQGAYARVNVNLSEYRLSLPIREEIHRTPKNPNFEPQPADSKKKLLIKTAQSVEKRLLQNRPDLRPVCGRDTLGTNPNIGSQTPLNRQPRMTIQAVID